MSTLDNPLLVETQPIPFDRIAAEHVKPAVDTLLAEGRAGLAEIGEGSRPATYEATLGALDRLTENLERCVGVVAHLESVATTPALREAFGAIQADVSAFFSSISMSEGAFGALRRFAATDEARALSPDRKRFLEKKLAEFRRNGAELDAKGKERLLAIDVDLANLTLRFSQNVLDATNAFELFFEDASALSGLPESALSFARESAAAKGRAGYRLTLQAPSYVPGMTYLDRADIREQLYRAYATRATSGACDNRPVVARILELRRERAKLLGYANFADFATEERMAKSGDAARRFVRMLREKAEPAFVRENEELQAFRNELEGPGAARLASWDVAYYAEKLRHARYDVDDEALRPYFSFDRVLAGAFELANGLYGLRVVPTTEAPIWHPEVRAFQLLEEDGTLVSRFYVDVFPRETKREGAWMDGLVTDARRVSSHLEALVMNVSPPSADRPALLTHREVETTFHEFGHLLHHASSRVAIRELAGTNVARDFVELPSQLMENWCWEREALDRFARHHQTNETIPEALFRGMLAARTFRSANATMRQLGFAELDLALHMDWEPGNGDPTEVGRAVLAEYTPAELPPDHAMAASFGHLFGSPMGYAAGYYSYKWAEVLEADAFSRFKAEGLYGRRVGSAFRESLLARGDSADPMDLYRAFMGREPALEALLTREGLLA